MLTVNNLVSGYGQSEVIHDVSFSADAGEIIAIMGRNGMGKTTLFKTLMGVLPVRSGTISVGGVDITKLDSYERVARGIAYVPQGRMVFPSLTVMDNIKTGLGKAANGRVPEDIFSLFPVLFDMSHRKGGNLSGGQQQQLAIARALATNPKVLLLDEPTEGIQPSIIKDMARTLKEIRDLKGLTIIVSEQVLSFTMAIADRLFVIDRGRFVRHDRRANVDVHTVSQYLAV